MHTSLHFRQRGASLITSLIMLIALTLVSLGSLGTSLMELRMANNAESGMTAFQMAQAGIDVTLATPSDYFIVDGVVGDSRCFNASGCTKTISTMPNPVASAHQIRITRVTNETCPPRTRNSASSCAKLHATAFVSESSYDNIAAGQGQAQLVQGYINLIPAGDNRDLGVTADVQN